MIISKRQNHSSECTDVDQIASLMAMLAPVDGTNATNLPGTLIIKSSRHTGRAPFLYNRGVILVGQGNKRIYLGDAIYEYNPENYLVISVPIPAECEIFATKDKPLLALVVDIDVGILNRIIRLMDEHIDHALLKQERVDLLGVVGEIDPYEVALGTVVFQTELVELRVEVLAPVEDRLTRSRHVLLVLEGREHTRLGK